MGQDLFVPGEHTNGLDGFKVTVVKSSSEVGSFGAEVGSDATVFTISPVSKLNLCLDYVQGHGSNHLQVWECNGHENQLFYFDPNSYMIVWGGDRSMCIDAGGTPKAGNQLALYPCKGYPQQKWGYDSKSASIYLATSMDATLCMDITGGGEALGTPVQIWNCDHQLWNQQWALTHGITIRSLANIDYCLDLAGGKTDKGTQVQLWRCNGHTNQKWIFDDGTIRPVMDTSKCIDASQRSVKGTPLMLWDCNKSPQQSYGYDTGNAKTIYLSLSTAEASLCLDIAGGQMAEGTPIQIWTCTECWNQQWQAFGPTAKMQATSLTSEVLSIRRLQNSTQASSDGMGFLAKKKDDSLQSSCPPRTHSAPVPAPGPPATPGSGVEWHCEQGSNYGWPVFKTYNDLNSSPWGAYYKMVYGEVPQTGYPICAYMLFLLYKPLLGQAGVQLPASIDPHCPTQAGTPFAKMSGFPSTDWVWIYNPLLGRPLGDYVPEHTWVEIIHTAYSMDGHATWMYYTPGSGIYAWTGHSLFYNDHPDAVKDLLQTQCSDPPGQIGNNECQNNFEDMYNAARYNKKAQTIQFKKHHDMQCDVKNNNDQRNMAIEIVDLGGPGFTSCSGSDGKSRFRAGWQAKYDCVCDNSKTAINCEGFGLAR